MSLRLVGAFSRVPSNPIQVHLNKAWRIFEGLALMHVAKIVREEVPDAYVGI